MHNYLKHLLKPKHQVWEMMYIQGNFKEFMQHMGNQGLLQGYLLGLHYFYQKLILGGLMVEQLVKLLLVLQQAYEVLALLPAYEVLTLQLAYGQLLLVQMVTQQQFKGIQLKDHNMGLMMFHLIRLMSHQLILLLQDQVNYQGLKSLVNLILMSFTMYLYLKQKIQ